jgi:TonB family protein
MRLAANPDERLSAPSRPLANRGLMAASLALCLLVHATAIYFLIDRDNAPASAPSAEEIPVELVAEPPPDPPAPPPEPQAQPEPEPPEPEPQQTAQTLDEKPAEDAPRDSGDGKAQQAAPDEVSKAPTVAEQATAPPPGQEARANDAPSPQPAPEPPAESTQATPDRPDAEALARAELRPAQTPPTPTQPSAPSAPAPPAKAQGDRFAGFQPLPDYEFSSVPQRAPVTGGQSTTTYLSTIFGMVRSHMRLPPGPHNNNMPVAGEVVFQVDRTGKLIQARIARPSGSSALDSAALAAIRAASPFPPTPTGTALGLRYSFSAR